MKVKFFTLIGIFLLVFSSAKCQKNFMSIRDSILIVEQQKLKEYSFCMFLAKNDTCFYNKMVLDGSTAGYFNTSIYNIDAFAKLDSIVVMKSKEINLSSKTNRPLLMMRAFLFMNDIDLENLIKTLSYNQKSLRQRTLKVMKK